MTGDDTDRNLLFGVLALQNNFVDHQGFVDAIRVWAAENDRPLAEILLGRGALTDEESALVEMLVARHLRKHSGNPRATLGAVAQPASLRAIRRVDDPGVRKSLLGISPVDDPGPQETLLPTDPGPASRHTLLRVLAQGGLGRVWVARDTGLNREVALKEILPEHAGRPEIWRRFYKEAQVTGQLQHPNIVPIYELARRQEDGQPFYTMRLVGGRTLAAAVARHHEAVRERGPDPPGRFELLQAFVSVCQAVGYAHSRGVIHRDLKPLNVMLGDFGETVVIDWGLAKVLCEPGESAEVEVTDHPGTQAGQVSGSPSYMAPEQAEGRQDLIDRRSDVYGLGAILYEILTGRPPFDGRDSNQVLAQVINGATPRAGDGDTPVPPPLDAVCARAMARDRGERYATASDLARDLQNWLTDEPVSAYREGPSERLARWSRRHRSWVRAGAAALALVALVSAAAALLIRAADVRERSVRDRELARLSRTRLVAQELVFNGQADALGGRWDDALLKLTGALNKVNDEPCLVDLKARAGRLLSETNRNLDERRSRRQSRDRHDRFKQAHDDALFNGTMVIGLDPEAGSRTAAALAREALALYGVTEDGAGPLAPDPRLAAEENGGVVEGCYELLLMLADLEANPGGPVVPASHPARLGRAGRALERAAGLGPSSWAYHARRSDVLNRLGKDREARAEAAKAASLPPAGAFDLFLAGRDAYQRDDPAAALVRFDRALLASPGHFWAQYLAALSLLKLGRAAEARAHLTACLGRRPEGFVWCYLLRGYADGEVNDFEAAEADFQKALALRPDAAARYGVLVNRGRSRILQNRPDPAAADLEEAVKLFPERYEARVNLARVHQVRGDHRAALAELDEAVRRGPGKAEAYRNRARLLIEVGDAERALRDLGEAVMRESRQPRNLAEDCTDIAAIHFRARRFRAATAACDRALAASPDSATALRLKAEALIELKLFEPAVALLDRYVVKGVPSADVYRARGLLRHDLGRPGEALGDFTRALEMDPDSSNVLAKRGWILSLDGLKLARGDFDRAIALNPGNADAYAGRGLVLARLGEGAAAARDADEAVRLAPAEPVMLYNAACVFSESFGRSRCDPSTPGRDPKSGTDADRALALLRRALDLMSLRDRASFWASTVGSDPSLDPIRRIAGFAELRAWAARPAAVHPPPPK